MRQFSISEKALKIWKARLYMLLILLSVISGMFFAFYRPLGVIFEIIVLTGFFTAWFWYLPRRLRSHQITAGKDAIMSERGVLVKTTYVMPYPRLLYAQLFSTPLSRFYNLSSIVLKAARGIIILPHLDQTAADEILSLIQRQDAADERVGQS